MATNFIFLFFIQYTSITNKTTSYICICDCCNIISNCKLTKDATPEQLKAAGLGEHFVNHDRALFYNNAAGDPFTATYIQAKGDPIADLYEDIAAEEKARATYQWIIDMSDDPDINDSLKFLREREIVHSLRFREAVEILKEDRNTKKFF